MRKCLPTFNLQNREAPFLFGNIQSLKLTEIAVDDFAARKKLFREMATRSARIVSDDLAVRRRSLAPVR
jgi:hypothetical protein